MHGVLRPHVTRHNSKAGYNTPFMATACHFLRLLKLLRWKGHSSRGEAYMGM